MDKNKETLLAELELAKASLTLAMLFPRILKVEEYADLNSARELVIEIHKRVSK